MSNCIEIRGSSPIPNTHIDGAKLLQDIKDWESIPEHTKDSPGYGDGVSAEDYMFYWYLTSDNVKPYREGVVIRFGGGRSTHTWRDMRSTLHFLSKYMLQDYKLEVVLADEYDGFETWGSYYWILSPGGLKDPIGDEIDAKLKKETEERRARGEKIKMHVTTVEGGKITKEEDVELD